MRNSSYIVRAGALAAVLLFAASAPVLAFDGSPGQSFPPDSPMVIGLSGVATAPAEGGYTATYQPAPGSCPPVTTHTRSGDTIVKYPAHC
jgi:hypothetical protein